MERKIMTKKIAIAAAAALFLLPSFAPANGFNLNGLGSRAQGMGGAYVSLANDFSAVFWNPAGAAGFKQKTFGFFVNDLIPTNTYSSEILIPEVPDIDAKTKTSHYLGMLAGFYMPVSSKVVLGLGVGTPSLYGTKWTGDDFTGLAGGASYIWMSKVAVLSLSPMVAVKLSEAVSVGAAINFNHGVFNLKKPAGTSSYPPQIDGPVAAGLADLGQYEETMNGWSFGATVGAARQAHRGSLHRPDRADPVDHVLQRVGAAVLYVPLRPSGHLRPGAGYAVAALDRRRRFVPAVRAPAPERRRPLDPVVQARPADDGLSRPRLGRPGRGRRTGRPRPRLEGHDPDPLRRGVHARSDDGPTGRLLPRSGARSRVDPDRAPADPYLRGFFDRRRQDGRRPPARFRPGIHGGQHEDGLLIPRTPCPGPTGPRWSCRRSPSPTSSSLSGTDRQSPLSGDWGISVVRGGIRG
ncbi:MAG: outer membrane protein transport protein [Ignavibacteriales bacterium]|nr:outer membrane protein transport protein [Ignavibacteriales bacterium]